MNEGRRKRELEVQAQGLQEDNSSLTTQLAETGERLELANRKLHQLSDALTEETKSKNLLIDEIKADFEEVTRKHTANVDSLNSEHQTTLDGLEQSLRLKEEEYARQEDNVAELESKVANLNKTKNGLTHRLSQTLEELDQKNNQNMTLNEQLSNTKENLRESTQEATELKQRNAKLVSDMETATNRHELAHANLLSAKNTLDLESQSLERQLEEARQDVQRIQKEWLQTTQQRDLFQRERAEALTRKQEAEDKWHEDYLQLERERSKLAGEKGLLERDLTRVQDRLKESEQMRERTQADLDRLTKDTEKQRNAYLNERSNVNNLQDTLATVTAARDRANSELSVAERAKSSVELELSNARREIEDMDTKLRNNIQEIANHKKELHNAQIQRAEMDIILRQAQDQAKAAQSGVLSKERLVEDLKTARASEKRASTFYKTEMENSVSELQQQVEDLTRRKDDAERKNTELQANLKALYVQVKEEMEKLKVQTRDSEALLNAEKQRHADAVYELKEALARSEEESQRQLAMLEQDNDRIHKQAAERERDHEGTLMSEREQHKRQLSELREQHGQAIDRSMRSAHQSENSVLALLEEERRQTRQLINEKDEEAQTVNRLRGDNESLKRDLSRSQDQLRKLEESKTQHTLTISKLMNANKELQRLIEHTRNDLEFIRRVEDLKRDQEQFEQSTANLQSFIHPTAAAPSSITPATPSRALTNYSSTRSPPRSTSRAHATPSSVRSRHNVNQSLARNTANISPIRDSLREPFRTGLSRTGIGGTSVSARAGPRAASPNRSGVDFNVTM